MDTDQPTNPGDALAAAVEAAQQALNQITGPAWREIMPVRDRLVSALDSYRAAQADQWLPAGEQDAPRRVALDFEEVGMCSDIPPEIWDQIEWREDETGMLVEWQTNRESQDNPPPRTLPFSGRVVGVPNEDDDVQFVVVDRWSRHPISVPPPPEDARGEVGQ